MNKLGQYLIGVAVCFAVLLILTMVGCGKGVGGWTPVDLNNVTITSPANMMGGLDADWTVSWTDSRGPFTVTWDFGSGTEQSTVTSTDVMGNTHATTATMINPGATEDATYTVTVTVANAVGVQQTATQYYTVGPAYIPLEITAASYNTNFNRLTVEATVDPRAFPVTMAITLPEGLDADHEEATFNEGPILATFMLTPEDYFAGGIGTVDVPLVITDSLGFTAQRSIEVDTTVHWAAADTLYVFPLTNVAKVGETVDILVATAALANPLQYIPAINVTMPDWVQVVPNSFNIGTLGGGTWDADGIWGSGGMGLVGDSFLHGLDPQAVSAFIAPPEDLMDVGIPGRSSVEFTIIPIGGQDVTWVEGAVFNFKVSFDRAGIASFGFLESVPPIDRTYYRDSENNNYLWGQLMANADGSLNLAGYDNTIMVTE